MTNPWQLYDDLIDALPADLMVTDALVSHFAYVSNDAGGHGLALADRGGRNALREPDLILGRPLREVAGLVKSWDFQLAGLGVAALNSWFNSADRVEASGLALCGGQEDSFVLQADRVRGKKVGVIGHFAGLQHLAAASELIVLERDPSGDDLPDPACEYELPSCEVAYITGTTLANKTLPRLLELAAAAHTVLVGPTSTFAPEVYGDLVQEIGGAWISDPSLAARLVRTGATMRSMKGVFTRFNAISRRLD